MKKKNAFRRKEHRKKETFKEEMRKTRKRNAFKERIAKRHRKEETFEEKMRKAEETVEQVLSFYERREKLTEKEKRDFLKIDENLIPDDRTYMIYYALRTYIEKGKPDSTEDYKKKFMDSKELILKRNPEKIQREIEERNEEGKSYDEREI